MEYVVQLQLSMKNVNFLTSVNMYFVSSLTSIAYTLPSDTGFPILTFYWENRSQIAKQKNSSSSSYHLTYIYPKVSAYLSHSITEKNVPFLLEDHIPPLPSLTDAKTPYSWWSGLCSPILHLLHPFCQINLSVKSCTYAFSRYSLRTCHTSGIENKYSKKDTNHRKY